MGLKMRKPFIKKRYGKPKPHTSIQPRGTTLAVTVIADASFCPQTRAGGWAAWLTSDKGRKQHAGCFHDLPKSPTEAELWAVLNGIWLAFELGATHILIQSDCTGALKLIDDGIPELSLFAGVFIRTKHVKGHTQTKDARSYVNRWCDSEAKKHMRKQRTLLENESKFTTRGFY